MQFYGMKCAGFLTFIFLIQFPDVGDVTKLIPLHPRIYQIFILGPIKMEKAQRAVSVSSISVASMWVVQSAGSQSRTLC